MRPPSIPVLRPRLPSAETLVPYLKRIDEARFYSNFGPLVIELQERLAQSLNHGSASVISAANATVAMTAALLAQDPAPGSLCIMPAWTFIASPLAALAAGLKPYFVDVSPDDWLLHPEDVTKILSTLDGVGVGAVMPVAAFGQPIQVTAWDEFRRRSGLAVVIDSAAGIDRLSVGETPNVVSLHATKALGAGEGGFVASTDHDLLRRIQTYCAFGFYGSRDAQVAGFNGKMSEYHAAVALAALDEWPETRAQLVARADAYRKVLHGSQGVKLQTGFGESWIANTCMVELPDGMGNDFARRLASAAIDTRLWWGHGAHKHPATRHLPCASLLTTMRLAESSLGLPFYVDLSFEDIENIGGEIRAISETWQKMPVPDGNIA